MLSVGIRLGDIFPLDIDALEPTGAGFIQHVRYAEARFIVQVNVPVTIEDDAYRSITNGVSS